MQAEEVDCNLDDIADAHLRNRLDERALLDSIKLVHSVDVRVVALIQYVLVFRLIPMDPNQPLLVFLDNI